MPIDKDDWYGLGAQVNASDTQAPIKSSSMSTADPTLSSSWLSVQAPPSFNIPLNPRATGGVAAAYTTSTAVQAATLVSGSAAVDDDQEVTDALDDIKERYRRTFLARAFSDDGSRDPAATSDVPTKKDRIALSQLSFSLK